MSESYWTPFIKFILIHDQFTFSARTDCLWCCQIITLNIQNVLLKCTNSKPCVVYYFWHVFHLLETGSLINSKPPHLEFGGALFFYTPWFVKELNKERSSAWRSSGKSINYSKLKVKTKDCDSEFVIILFSLFCLNHLLFLTNIHAMVYFVRLRGLSGFPLYLYTM